MPSLHPTLCHPIGEGSAREKGGGGRTPAPCSVTVWVSAAKGEIRGKYNTVDG